MKLKRSIAAIVLVSAFAGPVAAGTFEDAVDAHARGDYAKALRLIRPLANDGDAAAQFNLAGAIIDYPLEADVIKFYADAEEVLAKLPAGYQWFFASLKTGTPSRSRSAACNTSFIACAKPPAR